MCIQIGTSNALSPPHQNALQPPAHLRPLPTTPTYNNIYISHQKSFVATHYTRLNVCLLFSILYVVCVYGTNGTLRTFEICSNVAHLLCCFVCLLAKRESEKFAAHKVSPCRTYVEPILPRPNYMCKFSICIQPTTMRKDHHVRAEPVRMPCMRFAYDYYMHVQRMAWADSYQLAQSGRIVVALLAPSLFLIVAAAAAHPH